MRSPFNPMELIRNESESDPMEAISVEKYERCGFCNSKLLFNHDLNFGAAQVVETGRCSGCGVTMRPRRFTIH